MNTVGLVLEGGGMRGLFTSGVLDWMLDNNINFPYVIGASFGAINGVSYVSNQKGRTRRFIINNVNNPEYMGIRNLIRERSYFGIKYGYHEIPMKLDPFDFEAYYNSDSEMTMVLTNCETGRPEYLKKGDSTRANMIDVVRATGSLPFIAPEVKFNGKTYMDGGIADSIPIKQAEQDGYKKNIVILTRDLTYRKSPFKLKIAAKLFYHKYPKFVEALLTRHKMYNDTIEYIIEQEKKGNIFVIRPQVPVEIKRIEKNTKKLQELYDSGYNVMENISEELKRWMDK